MMEAASYMSRSKIDSLGLNIAEMTFLTGGSSISKELTDWFVQTTGARLIQGYGLTETCGFCTVDYPDNPKHGSSGVVVSNMRMKV